MSDDGELQRISRLGGAVVDYRRQGPSDGAGYALANCTGREPGHRD